MNRPTSIESDRAQDLQVEPIIAPRDSAPTVSVIVPTRDRLQVLQEAVASVQQQSFSRWECIVVDDASSDGTRNWLVTLEDPRIHAVVLESHRERHVARDHGVARASGKYLVFLDDDDRLTANALRSFVRGFRAYPNAVAVTGAMVVFDERDRHYKYRYSRIPLVHIPFVHDIRNEVLAGWVISGPCAYVADAFRDAGGWSKDCPTLDDLEFWLRFSAVGPWLFIPQVVGELRIHAGREILEPERAEEEDRRYLEVRDRYLRTVSPEESATAARLLAARGAIKAALQAFQADNFGLAVARYREALRTGPELWRSPMTGLWLVVGLTKSIMGSVLGRRGMDVMRAIKHGIRHTLRRDPSA